MGVRVTPTPDVLPKWHLWPSLRTKGVHWNKQIRLHMHAVDMGCSFCPGLCFSYSSSALESVDTLAIVSKLPTCKRVPFQELVLKFNLFVRPTKYSARRQRLWALINVFCGGSPTSEHKGTAWAQRCTNFACVDTAISQVFFHSAHWGFVVFVPSFTGLDMRLICIFESLQVECLYVGDLLYFNSMH